MIHPFYLLKSVKRGVGMYLGPPCYCYAFSRSLVYLAIPGTPPLHVCMKLQHLFVLFCLYATAKRKIQICSNKHETSLVTPVLSDHSKTDKTRMLMTNCTLMKVETIAECSPWSILQYF